MTSKSSTRVSAISTKRSASRSTGIVVIIPLPWVPSFQSLPRPVLAMCVVAEGQFTRDDCRRDLGERLVVRESVGTHPRQGVGQGRPERIITMPWA